MNKSPEGTINNNSNGSDIKSHDSSSSSLELGFKFGEEEAKLFFRKLGEIN